MAQHALEIAKQAGASYADVRIIRSRNQSIDVKSGRLERVSNHYEGGIGIRTLVNGAWGFAGNPDLKMRKVEKAVKRAIEIAKCSVKAKREPVKYPPIDTVRNSWHSPCEESPFDVPLEDKLDILFECDKLIREVEGVALSRCTMDFREESKLFVSSEGSVIRQKSIQSGAGISATSVGEGGVHTYSYPQGFRGQFENRGFEMIRNMPLKENARKVAETAVALQTAPEAPSGTGTLILGGLQLALQVHESCGHPSELDRALGTEVNFAGSTFMQPETLGKLKYGSDLVTITSDATIEGSLGSFGWDDEGVKGQRFNIIDKGMFVEYQTSRETAASFGVRANGTMLAQGWNNVPLIRMSTISLEPGNTPYADLISSTEKGLLICNNQSWSIDDKRVNFQFGGEAGWLVENGKITTMVKNPIYSGKTTEFWNSCDCVADKDTWSVVGLPNCGKGLPMQTMRVAHGVSYARFQNVRLGVNND
jgi:TldD protein